MPLFPTWDVTVTTLNDQGVPVRAKHPTQREYEFFQQIRDAFKPDSPVLHIVAFRYNEKGQKEVVAIPVSLIRAALVPTEQGA